MSPRWGESIRTSTPDQTGSGILTEFMLGAPSRGIQVMGTYFPCPNTIGGHTNRLWDETLEWLEQRQLSESPHTYLQRQIQQRTLRHLGKAATGDRPARNIIIIGGDFSAIWNWCHGPLRGLGHWATTSSLFSPLADLPDPTLLASYYQRRAQVPHRPYPSLATMPGNHRTGGSMLGHSSATSPGSTGLTYNKAKDWPTSVTTYGHQCLLTSNFGTQSSPRSG